MTTTKCKFCGEHFKLTKEEIELHNEGFCDLPDTCEECYEIKEDSLNMPDDCYSDADSGL